jgi:hypothetical protein
MKVKIVDNVLPTGAITKEEREESRVMMVIDHQILDILHAERLFIDQLFVLLAVYEDKFPLLDTFDIDNTMKTSLLCYADLQAHGFLEFAEGKMMYKISDKGKALVEKIKPLFEGEEQEKDDEEAFRTFCKEYLEIFPKMRLPSNKYARVSIVEIEKKMRGFLKVYRQSFKKDYGFKLTYTDILDATKSYVSRYAKMGYQFMVTSSYFIQKNEKSALADEIIAMKQGTSKVVNKFEKQI